MDEHDHRRVRDGPTAASFDAAPELLAVDPDAGDGTAVDPDAGDRVASESGTAR